MLDELRSLLANPQTTIFLGLVTKVDTAVADHLVVELKAIPEGHDLVAAMTFPTCVTDLPQLLDIAVVALSGDHADNAWIISLIPRTQSNFIIPPRTIAGEAVVRSRTGKKLNISSDTRVNIGKGGVDEEAEPLVLGTQLNTLLTTVLTQVSLLADAVSTNATKTQGVFDLLKSGPITIAGSGAGPTDPGLVTALGLPANIVSSDASDDVKDAIDEAKGDYLDDSELETHILSQIAFTEKGAPE